MGNYRGGAMPTVVKSTEFSELWADPKLVAARCPDEFTYHEITTWNEITVYPGGDLVLASDGLVYRANQDSVPMGVEPITNSGGPTDWWVLDPEAQAEQDLLERAIGGASWVLWSLTNGVYHGEQCWQEDYRLQGCKLRLRRGPVRAVIGVYRVHHCGQFTDPFQDWCQESVNTLSFCCGPCPPYAHPSRAWLPGTLALSCGCDSNVVRVLYAVGSNLPPGASDLVAWLACEYAKASTGKACSLPERVTNITRQGVSWTVLDPQEFLDKGMLGVSRVDQWLSVARRSISGEFIDPMRGVRLFSHPGDCGGAFGDEDVTDRVPDPFSRGFDTE